MTSFDFSEEERWDPNSALMLPPGNHICTIRKAEEGTTRNGNDQIEVQVEKGGDTLRDWIVITPATLGKVIQLAEAAGVENPGAVSIPSTEWSAWVEGLVGKKVGVIIRDEPHYDTAKAAQGQTQRKVQAYCTVEELGQESSDVPADMAGFASGPQAQDDDIPF
jgi:hypothetical protein